MRDQAVRAAGHAWRSSQGSVAIIIALTLTVLIGFVALGTEVGFAMYKQSQMQSVASSAALGGATALMTGHPTNPATEAQAIAATMGFTNGTAGVTVTVNHPPLTGPNAGSATAVEVIVAQPQTLPLSTLFRAGPWNITGRAVATEGNSASDCVLALDPNTTTAVDISITNGANVALNQCGLAVDADGPCSLTVSNGGVLTAKSVSVGGFTCVNNGGSITSTNGVKTQQTAPNNPYSGTPVPSLGGCTTPTNITTSPAQPLSPGTYCGGLTMGNGATVAMNGGVYVIDGGTFSVQGGVTLTGTGVTIVLTGTGSNYATVSIANGANVTLAAQTTGTYAGMAIFQDPNAPVTTTANTANSIEGGAQLILTGALYFPSQALVYGNGSSTTSTCTQVVAWQISFQGGAALNSNCGSTGTKTIGATPSRLVE